MTSDTVRWLRGEKVILCLYSFALYDDGFRKKWGWYLLPARKRRSLWSAVEGNGKYVRKADARRAARNFAWGAGFEIAREEEQET